MAHYVGVFVPLDAGGWRALFPDVPQCRIERDSLDRTILSAASELARFKSENGHPLSPPRSLVEIRSDTAWAEDTQVDWSKSIVTMIPLRG